MSVRVCSGFTAGRLAPLAAVLACFAWPAQAAEAVRTDPDQVWRITVKDTLPLLTDDSADAQAALDGLVWEPVAFEVEAAPLRRESDEADAVLRFPSPRPCGDRICDTATLHWYAARDADGKVIRAPAVVVVHESGSRQTIGRLFARAFRDKGVHAFLLSLPNYGLRRSPDIPGTAESLLIRMKQGIADARRARDVVAAIPQVMAGRLGILGISLGGFVTATMAGLDHSYHCVFIMLAGGDLAGIIREGGDVAANMRERLAAMGITSEQINELARPVEPLRLAHRLDPEHTWLYSATKDQIVPAANSQRLADAAHLPASHHIRLWADHYTGVVYYAVILNSMIERLSQP